MDSTKIKSTKFSKYSKQSKQINRLLSIRSFFFSLKTGLRRRNSRQVLARMSGKRHLLTKCSSNESRQNWENFSFSILKNSIKRSVQSRKELFQYRKKAEQIKFCKMVAILGVRKKSNFDRKQSIFDKKPSNFDRKQSNFDKKRSIFDENEKLNLGENKGQIEVLLVRKHSEKNVWLKQWEILCKNSKIENELLNDFEQNISNLTTQNVILPKFDNFQTNCLFCKINDGNLMRYTLAKKSDLKIKNRTFLCVKKSFSKNGHIQKNFNDSFLLKSKRVFLSFNKKKNGKNDLFEQDKLENKLEKELIENFEDKLEIKDEINEKSLKTKGLKIENKMDKTNLKLKKEHNIDNKNELKNEHKIFIGKIQILVKNPTKKFHKTKKNQKFKNNKKNEKIEKLNNDFDIILQKLNNFRTKKNPMFLADFSYIGLINGAPLRFWSDSVCFRDLILALIDQKNAKLMACAFFNNLIKTKKSLKNSICFKKVNLQFDQKNFVQQISQFSEPSEMMALTQNGLENFRIFIGGLLMRNASKKFFSGQNINNGQNFNTSQNFNNSLNFNNQYLKISQNGQNERLKAMENFYLKDSLDLIRFLKQNGNNE